MKDSLKQFYKDNSPDKKVVLSAETKQKIKFSLLSKIGNMDRNTLPEQKSSRLINLKTLFLKSYVVIPLAVLLLISGSTIVSANSLPGDALYPFKRGVETVSVFIAPTEQEKTDLKVEFAKKRIAELESLKQRGDITDDSIQDDATAKTDIKAEDAQIKNESNSKTNNHRRASKFTPIIQKRIKDDAEKAHKILDDIERRVEHRSENDSEDKGLDDKFKIQQQGTEIKTNTDLKVETRSTDNK